MPAEEERSPRLLLGDPPRCFLAIDKKTFLLGKLVSLGRFQSETCVVGTRMRREYTQRVRTTTQNGRRWDVVVPFPTTSVRRTRTSTQAWSYEYHVECTSKYCSSTAPHLSAAGSNKEAGNWEPDWTDWSADGLGKTMVRRISTVFYVC